MVNSMKISIFAGEGGHVEQAKRLKKKFASTGYSDVEIYSDSLKYKTSSTKRKLSVLPISKYSKSKYFSSRCISFVFILLETFRFTLIFLFTPSRKVILQGPMMCVPILLSCILTKTPVVFIETWSRFESPTKTGRLCAKLGVKCFYQNKSLSCYYSRFNGKFIGRL